MEPILKNNRRLIITTVLCLGIIFSLGMFAVVRQFEQKLLQDEFNKRAHDRLQLFKGAFDDHIDALLSIRGLYASSKSVERREFCIFTHDIVVKHQDILSLDWIPRVLASEVPAYKEAARTDGFPDFTITEINKEGKQSEAAARPEYFPVYYTEPVEQNKIILGLDIASDPIRRKAIESARDNDELVATDRIKLIREAKENKDFACRIFIPVYRKDSSCNTTEDRRQNLIGFVSALFRVGDMLESSLKSLANMGLDTYIYDETAATNEQFLYFHSARMRKHPVEAFDKTIKAYHGMKWSGTINIPERTWRMDCYPCPEFFNEYKEWQSWLVLVLGLLITFMLAVYLFTALTYTLRVEALVKERTEQLNETKENLSVTLHSIGDGVIATDIKGNITLINAAAEELTGWKKEEAIGRLLEEVFCIVDEKNRTHCANPVREVLEKGHVVELVNHTILIAKDGTEKILADSAAPITDSKSVISGVVLVFRDVTEQKLVQDKIARAAKDWQDTFDSISDMVFILDKESRVVKVNKAMLKALNVRAEDMLGKKCYEIVHKKGSPWPNCPHQKTIIDKKAHTEEVEDPGLGLPLLVTTSPILDETGELVGSIHISKDISDIKRREQEINKAKEELERKNAQLRKLDILKNEFVSTVSHELRTPLTIMKEGVSIVLDRITGDLSEKQEKTLSMVYSNINRLAKLINDLLDISKIEAGRMELKKGLTDISGLIKDTCAKFKPELDKKRQELVVEAPQEALSIYVDHDKMIQVITNLVSNAMKYTPEKGKIAVAVTNLKEEVEISVSDNGIGIVKEDMPRVFEKFQQFSREPGAGIKGTGLGLAITKQLVEMHQGRISVESEPRKGTTFTVIIPKMDSETVFKEHIQRGILQVAAKQSRLSLIVIKVSGFANIQKELGHEKTYELLKDIELLFHSSLRDRTDTIVRDTGEIVIVLTDTPKENAIVVKSRIEELIQSYLSKSNKPLIRETVFTIGMATYPEDAKTDVDLLNKARGVVKAKEMNA